jgi:hypothetical protein
MGKNVVGDSEGGIASVMRADGSFLGADGVRGGMKEGNVGGFNWKRYEGGHERYKQVSWGQQWVVS